MSTPTNNVERDASTARTWLERITPSDRKPVMWFVYHARLDCRAADPLQVRPCEWIRQTTCPTEEQAASVARAIAESRGGVHAKITSRRGTRHFAATE